MTESLTRTAIQSTPLFTKNVITPRARSGFSLAFRLALILSLACLLISTRVSAQTGAPISSQATTPTGTPANHAQITVCPYTSSGAPCFPQSNIYSDPGLTVPLTQPYSTDQYGNYSFWVANNATYLVQVKVSSTLVYSYYKTVGSGGGSSVTLQTNSIANTSQSLLNFVNPAAFNGLTFTFQNTSGGIETFAVGGTLNNAGLTNSTMTVNGVVCTLGAACTAPGASSVNVNGTAVSNPNFNGTTPAAPGGNQNITFQSNIGGSISAYVPIGAGSPLTTKGDLYTFSTVDTRLGVGIDGQALLADSTQTTGLRWGQPVTSGVQYNPANTQIVIMGASNNGDDQGNTLGPTVSITSWSCNSVTCSFINTGSNGFAAGDWVYTRFAGSWPNSTTLNTGVTLFKVDAAGLSSTTFQITFGPNYFFTGSGTGGTVEAANGFLPVQISNAPFFKGHGVMSFIGDTAQSLAVNFNTAVGTATTSPAYLILTSLWTNDIGNKRTAAQIEADLATVWASAHSNGWTVVQGFDYPIQWNTSTLGNPNAYQTWAAVYKWIQGQGWNVFNIAPYCSTTCGKYWDSAVDNSSILRDGANTNLSNNGNLGVLSTGGVKRLADYYNAAMANQGSIVGSYPSFLIPAPFASGNLYGNTFGYAFAPTADSHQAFNFYNAALTTDFLNIDTVSNIIQLPYLTPTATSLVSIATGNGQLGTKTIQGTDTAILSADPTSIGAAATGATFCKSANGGATATGCSGGSVANTTTSVGTTAIAANTCTTATTVTMTGMLTSSVIEFTPSTDISTVTGWGATGGLTIVAWPTANTLNYKVCNQTAASITPSSSVTFNVGAR